MKSFSDLLSLLANKFCLQRFEDPGDLVVGTAIDRYGNQTFGFFSFTECSFAEAVNRAGFSGLGRTSPCGTLVVRSIHGTSEDGRYWKIDINRGPAEYVPDWVI